jgi:hypothetical protein
MVDLVKTCSNGIPMPPNEKRTYTNQLYIRKKIDSGFGIPMSPNMEPKFT